MDVGFSRICAEGHEGIPPASEAGPGHRAILVRGETSWIWTVILKTLYVLFFIELGSRRVHLTGATRSPNRAFATQQARNLCFELDRREAPALFLIRDRDSKFSGSFDEVFRTEGIRIILTPGRRHLDRVLRSYVRHYNAQRPHRGLGLRSPESHCDVDPVEDVPEIERRDLVGGLIHEYHAVAA